MCHAIGAEAKKAASERTEAVFGRIFIQNYLLAVELFKDN